MVGHANMEDVGRVDAAPSHKHGLLAGAWKVFEDPAVLQAILCLEPLREDGNEKAVLQASPFGFELLTDPLPLHRVSLNRCLYGFSELNVDRSRVPGKGCSKRGFATHW